MIGIRSPAFLAAVGGAAGPSFSVTIAGSGVLTATVTTISATGAPAYAYDWRRDGVSLGATDAATYDTAGTPGLYTVRVTGTDDAGSRARLSNAIQIGAVAVYEAGIHEEGVYL
jgi:hypothetical protein